MLLLLIFYCQFIFHIYTFLYTIKKWKNKNLYINIMPVLFFLPLLIPSILTSYCGSYIPKDESTYD